MRHTYFSLLTLGLSCALAVPAAYAQTPAWTGAVQTINPTPTNDTFAAGQHLATDAAGNTYVSGVVGAGGGSGAPGTRAFGSTNITSTGLGSGFIAKLSPALQWQWAVRTSTTGFEGTSVSKVATTPAGDVFALGYLNEPSAATLNVGGLSQAITSSNTFFVTRLNTNGQPQWIALNSMVVASSASNVRVEGFGYDAATNSVVVAGTYYGGPLTFGTTVLPSAPSPAGGLFVARLSAAGQWQSAVSFLPTNTVSNSDITPYSVAIGPQGQVGFNINVERCTLTLGSTVLTSATNADTKTAVAQLSAANQWQWVAQPSTVKTYYSNDMKYDPAGNLWLLGDAESGAQLGSTTIANGEEFVARLTSAGQWGAVGIIGFQTGKSAGDGEALAIDGQGNAVVAGGLNAATTYTFGPYTLTTGTTDRQYVARFSTGGQWQYAVFAPSISQGISASADYSFASVALDPSGNLLATGKFQGSSVFGTTTLSSSVYGDAFVARLSNAGLPLAVRQAAGVAPLAVYPNPAATGTSATLRLPVAAPAAQPLVLRDALGRVARELTIPAGRREVAVSTAGLAPGLYLLEAGLSRTQLVVE